MPQLKTAFMNFRFDIKSKNLNIVTFDITPHSLRSFVRHTQNFIDSPEPNQPRHKVLPDGQATGKLTLVMSNFLSPFLEQR